MLTSADVRRRAAQLASAAAILTRARIDAINPINSEQLTFADYCEQTYKDYKTSAHIDLIVSTLQEAIDTPNSRTIITMPPRHSKSVHTSELLPGYALGQHPHWRVMASSHMQQLADMFSRRVRNRINNPRWPYRSVRVAHDKGAVQRWDIEGTDGGYVAVGRGGSPTGEGANLLIVDDPIRNAADAESQTVRDAVWEWWTGTMYTRLEPGGIIILTATRWHDDDLTGRLLEAEKHGGEHWNHLHLPAICDSEDDPLGREIGEALWPERFPIERLNVIRENVGARVWNAQYQGRPSPDIGAIIQRQWWHYYEQRPDLDSFDRIIQSWDMTFKKTDTGSYIVGQVWGARAADRYLLDQMRFRGDFPAAINAMRAMSAAWPMSSEKIVEDKANGPAIVATLRNEIPGIIEVTPEGGKVARANAVAWMIEAGNVYIPAPSLAPWVDDFVEECSVFPNGVNDDQVDSMTQALTRLHKAGPAFSDNIEDFLSGGFMEW